MREKNSIKHNKKWLFLRAEDFFRVVTTISFFKIKKVFLGFFKKYDVLLDDALTLP